MSRNRGHGVSCPGLGMGGSAWARVVFACVNRWTTARCCWALVVLTVCVFSVGVTGCTCGESVSLRRGDWVRPMKLHAPSMPEESVPPSRLPIRHDVESWGLPRVSLSAVGASVAGVLSDLAISCEVPVVIPAELDKATVTVEFDGVDGQVALAEVARAAGYVPEFVGGVVRFVKADQVLQSFVLVRPGAERRAAALEGLKSVVAQRASVAAVGERLVVTGDPQAVDRAAEFAAQLESGSDGWVVEVRVFSVSRSWQASSGVDWRVSGAVGVAVDAAVGNRPAAVFPVFGARAAATVEALFAASEEGREVQLTRSGRVFVVEGQEGRLQQGDVVPVPRRTVSDQGTVTVTGYERVDTGFQLVVTPERVPGGVRLDVEARLSAVSGFVGEAPITSESSVRSTVLARNGDWVLLSGLVGGERERRSNGLPGAARLLGGAEQSGARDTDVVVAVLARRVVSSELMAAEEVAR